MKPLVLIALFLCACQHIPQSAVTAPARSSVTAASAATGEARAASERSSVHIRNFRNDAKRIETEAGKVLIMLDKK